MSGELTERRWYARQYVIQLLLFLAVLGGTVQLWQGNQARATNRATLQEILSCTRPAGTCARRGQAAQGQVIARLEDEAIVAAWCSAQQPRPPLEDVRLCVQANTAR